MLRVVALVALSGCSVLTVNGPHSMEVATNRPNCTDSYVLPAIDAVIAAATATGMIYFISKGDELGTMVEGAFALGFGINALVGMGRVKRCKRAITTFESTVLRQDVYMPAPVMPAPSP